VRLPGCEPCATLRTVSGVIVVGGGVIGTMHARAAVERGHTVLHLEADLEPRLASVRNFGLVWVSGRAEGDELELALRARELWEAIGADVPGVGFRPDGSLTIAQEPGEVAVLEAVCARADAAQRGIELFDADEARRRNPAVQGKVLAAMHCALDAIVEPGRVLPAVRAGLEASGRYEFRSGRTVVEADSGFVRDHRGDRHDADVIVVCPGAAHQGLFGDALESAPLRRCRLQMMQTEPLDESLTTAIADGDSLRYYPAFAVPELAELAPPPPVVEQHRIQLLVAQRATGALTIGDTHAYEEPYDFAVEEEPYEHLVARVESILGRRLPPIRRRWAGVYSQATDAQACVRLQPVPGVTVVTGLGGRGMTLSPAVAELTMGELGL
jgi:FAD dependent oxidoreductase TIGR03364